MKTNIEWASHTLNFYTWDCTKVSEGCKHCYMMVQAERYGKSLVGKPQWRGKNAMRELRKLPTGAVVFVNSMSDTYHESVPDAWIHSIHNMAAYVRPDVTFLLLTKRPERAYAMRHVLAWPENLWIGTSVESERYLWRLDYLLEIPAAGHFVSAEPLMGSLRELQKYLQITFKHEMFLPRRKFTKYGDWYALARLRQHRLGWVIVGGESGAERRPFEMDWAREIRDACLEWEIPFMFKQGSAFAPGRDRLLDGRTWDESPFAVEETSPPSHLPVNGEGEQVGPNGLAESSKMMNVPTQMSLF